LNAGKSYPNVFNRIIEDTSNAQLWLIGTLVLVYALLRFADLAEDAPLLQHARHVAPQLLLSNPEAAHAHVQRWLGNKAEYFKA